MGEAEVKEMHPLHKIPKYKGCLQEEWAGRTCSLLQPMGCP